MDVSIAWLVTGMSIGLALGLEVARRAFKDCARRLHDSTELMASMSRAKQDRP